MYRDPALIKKHVCKVRLDDDLDRKIEALADLTGEQKAVIVRRLIEIGLHRFHGADDSASCQSVEVTPSAQVQPPLGR
jgi:hypothetical protein